MQDLVKGGVCFFSTPPHLVFFSAGGIYSLLLWENFSMFTSSALYCSMCNNNNNNKDVNRDQHKGPRLSPENLSFFPIALSHRSNTT